MTGPQANQQYDLWVDWCRQQLERGAAGNALTAWMQAEGVNAEMAAAILEAAQGGAAALPEQPSLENSGSTATGQTASWGTGTSEASTLPSSPAPNASAEPIPTESPTTPPVDPIDSPRPEHEAPAPHPPELQAQRARAHEDAAAAFAKAFSKSARLSRGGASPASPSAGHPIAMQGDPEALNTADPVPQATPAQQSPPEAPPVQGTPDILEPAPQAPPTQPSPPAQPSPPGPISTAPELSGYPTPLPPEVPVDSGSVTPLTSVDTPPASTDQIDTSQPSITPSAQQPRAELGQPGQNVPSELRGGDRPEADVSAAKEQEEYDIPSGIDADETAAPKLEVTGEMEEGSHQFDGDPTEPFPFDEAGSTDDLAHRYDFGGTQSEMPVPAEEPHEATSPDAGTGAAEPDPAIADPPAPYEPAELEESPDETISFAADSHSPEPEPLNDGDGRRTDLNLPDVAEPAIGPPDQDAAAATGEVAAGADDSAGETSVESPKRPGFGRRSTAPRQPAANHEHTPSAADGDARNSAAEELATEPTHAGTHDLPAEGSTIKPAESEMKRLLDEADRAADPEPHMPPRLANPKTDQEIADAAKLLGISFRDDPKRPRVDPQFEEDDETVKTARQLGISFRDEPERADTRDLEDPMTRAALELGISFRDVEHSKSEQKNTLRRYWPIILVLALAAIAMPIAAAMLMFMGDS